MRRLELFLFGAPRLLYNGQPVELSLHKGLALLIYLAMTGQAHSRDALAALLWPEQDQSRARANVRRTLYRIHQDVGADLLSAGPDRIELDPGVQVALDIVTFQEHAQACLEAPEGLSTACRERLAQAVALYQQGFLAGFSLPDAPAFDEWQFFEAEGLRQTLSRLLLRLASADQADGNFAAAITAARRLVGLEPLRESYQRLLMRLYAQAGQQAAALRQYKELERLLKNELDIAPEAETAELHARIRLGKELPPDEAATPSRPEVCYTRSGEVHIAYQVVGSGPVDLVFVNGFLSHLEQIWEEPGLAGFNRRLAAFSRLILFDKRGMGLSDRVGYPPSLENTVQDILAVMEAAGARQAYLMGVSEGGPACLLAAAQHPERVAGVVIYGSMAKWIKSPDYPYALTPEQHERWMAALTENWGQALNLELFAPSRSRDPRFQQWWARALRIAASPGDVRQVLEAMRAIDVRPILAELRVPALVLHRAGDRAIRVGGGRYLARQIPAARYLELPGEDHWWWVGDSEAILRAIATFIQGK